MRVILFLLVFLAACGRPLTPLEQTYLKDIQGTQTDTTKMRLVNGHFASEMTYKIPVRPRTTCQERIWPPITQERTVTVAPAATVLFNKVLIRQDLFRPDFLAGYPEQIDLLDAMLMAHEATHVWQWQNRAKTGYTPLKALLEHTGSADPYLFDPDKTRDFLDYGYEQQGSIVEEYVCCRLLDPEAPRTERLRAMISAHMPLQGLDKLDDPTILVPWPGIQAEGICR
ncbi:hypothetical protein [Tropicibacter naphthalenivorans]|uniref:DUF4157 domain-containing protein n=1 Tax=Tropicibacter naphthalenivorans TaxID=441103 RepID=A0A0N7LZT9_9RHOB|nr:hypothetical protein [Tropicibacter naphthalenivorans]CUH78593.1 hypothetical protein TRN7648_02056 [Tropicibacter naphthalenivorans]SMC80997.1 hypothetical protein SAMN04488093_104218 [Tropicibacter naphthalenivorans]